MKLSFHVLTLAAMAAVAAATGGVRPAQKHRQLDDIDYLCIMCGLCDILDAACDLGVIQDFACGSCGADGGDSGGIPACFSGETTVQVQGEQKTMMQLQVGDSILTENGQFETVYGFGHHNPNREAEFFQVFNEESPKAPLEMTAEHLVFLKGQDAPVPVEQVKVGDVLRTVNAAGSKVTKISTTQRSGIYAPLTTGGTLVVDGVVASSYVRLPANKNTNVKVLSDHDMVHLTLAPYRLVCFGVSSSFCGSSFSNEDGMPYYAYYGLEVLRIVNGIQNVVLRLVGLAMIMGVTGAFRAAEVMFGASLAPLVIGILFFVSYRKKNQQNKTKAL